MDESKLMAQLIEHEGFRTKPYLDTVGKWTIGIGRNLDDVGITRSEALYLLKNDIDKVVVELTKTDWYDTLSDVRKRVVVDMAFNLGIAGFFKFKRTINSIRHGNYNEAARQMLQSKWARQVGRRAIKLATMMRTDKDV